MIPIDSVEFDAPVETTDTQLVDATVTDLLDGSIITTAVLADGSTVLATLEAPLTDDDRAELDTLETTIETGVAYFVSIGLALATIRERRLYRDGYASFDDYTAKRFGWSRQNASLMIRGATMSQELVALGLPAPSSERLIRPLTRMDGPVATAVWVKAGEKAGENHPIRTRHVNAAMKEMGVTPPTEVKVRTPAPPVVPTLEAVLARFRGEIAVAITAMNAIDGTADLEWTEVSAKLMTEVTSVVAEMNADDETD